MMNFGSLYLMLVLSGQLGSGPADSREAAPAAELDAEIETADENPEVDGMEPAGLQSAGLQPAANAPRDAAPPPRQQPASNHVAPLPEDLAPTANVPVDPAAPDSLLHWLATADTSLDGKRVTLVDLLSRFYDRSQQAVVIPSYWKLAASEYEYRIAADEALRLEQLLPPADAAGKHATDPLLEARLAAAEARLREAELAVINQQHVLADQMRLPASEPLPLTSDLPHAGAYRTYFQERYIRTAPPRAHLIDRTLPLLHRSIELRAAAAASAADYVEAAIEAYHAGQLDLGAVMASMAELTRERRAFTAAVRDYNLDIAEYALAVVPAGLSSAQLVSILIGPPPATRPAAPADGRRQPADAQGGVDQASYNEPLFAPGGQPTLAPVRPATNLPAAGGERTSPRQDSGAPGAPRRGRAAPGQGGQPPRRIKSASPRSTGARSMKATRHQVAKPPSGAPAGEGVGQSPLTANATEPGGDQGLYSALDDLAPAKRAQELSAALHWLASGPEALGTPTTLAAALTATAGMDRRAVLQAYWRASEEAAVWQVAQQEVELLRALEPAALDMRTQPGGAEAMLHLRTSQLAAQAAVQECLAGVLDAQFNLAQLMRQPLDGPWPLPSTTPHAGTYRLKLDAQPSTVLESSAVRQLTTALPIEHDSLEARADAIMAADTARVEAVRGFESGQRSLDAAVSAVHYLSRQTEDFLALQTTYNAHFADYVLTVAPPGIADSTLASALVVTGR